MDRLAMLEKMVAAKPDDPFPKYGRAMELKKLGRNDEADGAFDQLLEAHPGYVPAFLMSGNLLESMGKADAARARYARGVEVAQAAGDDHAMSELQAALTAISGED